jgi:hypothetical protein
MAQGMTDMAAAKNEGLDNAIERTTQNTTPTSFREWCEEVLRPVVNGDAGLGVPGPTSVAASRAEVVLS